MKIVMYIVPVAIILSAGLYVAHGGGGHGGGGHHREGGGHHGGGGRGHGHHDSHRSHNGHWSNHHGGHGHGWHGNHWHGPYYYGGWWWGPTGLFLVGLTFYTYPTSAIQNTNTWVIYNGDTTVYQSWPENPGNLTVMEVDNDPDGYDYRICNGNSCVKARPTDDD